MGQGELKLRGKIRCPIYRRVIVGDRSHIVTSGDYELPALIDVKCKGEGAERRCTATYSDCPSAQYEGDAAPTAPARKKVSGLRPPSGVVRSRDNSGSWYTQVEWEGKEGYTGWKNERTNESFEVQIWDGGNGEHSLHYDAAEFQRPYPRADKVLKRDGWHMQIDRAAQREVARAIREAATQGVGRNNEREVFHQSPPIRVGGEEIDWSGRGFDGTYRRKHGRRR